MHTDRRRFLAGSAGLAASAALGLPATRAAAQDATTINWWHITTAESDAALMQASADEFAAANDVEIEITVLENEAFKARLTTVMQGGEPPDVFQSWGGGVLAQYAAAGLVRDLTDDLAVDGWGDSFGQAGLNLYASGGRNYGVPRDLGMIGVWYSTSKFAEAGIEAPPETWSDFLATVQQIKDAGITPIAIGGGDRWPIHFYFSYLAIRHGGQAAYDAAYTGEGSFADEPFVNAAADLLALAELEPFQDGFLAATYPDSGVLYASGDAAMMLMGHWFPGGVLDANLDDPTEMRADLGWFPFPVVEGGAGAPNDVLGGGNGFAIGANAPDIAVDFVRHLTSLDTQQTWAAEGFSVPPTVIGAESVVTDENLLPVMEYLQDAGYFQLYYDQDLPPATGQVVLEQSQALVAGQQTPEGMTQAIQAAYEMDLGSS
jgi:raffinose/stachyose/melibiose transport system substrate-binding protein